MSGFRYVRLPPADPHLLPEKVVIYTPMPSGTTAPRGRGVTARGAISRVRSLRLSDEDDRTIRKAYELIGVSFNLYARWCCLQTAKQVIDHYEEHKHDHS
jgi:hypothetical protein